MKGRLSPNLMLAAGFDGIFNKGYRLSLEAAIGKGACNSYCSLALVTFFYSIKAISLGIEGPYTSWWHMFGWNVFGLILMGPAVATYRFFDTLNKVETALNERSKLS